MEKLTKLEILDNFSRKFGNDQELGKQYRKFIMESDGKLDELTKNNPNDFGLGKEIRKIFKK